MKALLALLLLSPGLFAQTAAPAAPGKAETDFIEQAMKKHAVPGASIAILEAHQKLWAAGFGVQSRARSQRVDHETCFQAASVSKPTAAMGALVLCERGVLSLDQDVNAKLRKWRLKDNSVSIGEKASLRRILSHSAGLSVHGFGGYALGERRPDLEKILEGKPPANSPPVVFERKPGTVYQYSGGGYCVLQMLMQDVSAKPFDALMDELVLQPCRMNSSSYQQPLAARLEKNRADGHLADGKRVEGGAHIYPEQAAAGLWTTANDFANLLLAIDRAFNTPTPPVFSKQLCTGMMEEQLEKCGLGWHIGGWQGHSTIYHGGSNEGFKCEVWLCPDTGQGYAIFTNSDNGSAFIREVWEALVSGKFRGVGMAK